MKKKIIVLIILIVFILAMTLLIVTSAFMKVVENNSDLTEVSLSSCAKITLEGEKSINLENSYPMSRNRGLQTTPYTFKVTTSCDAYVGFELYIATLNSNTMDASNIHYIITNKESKKVLAEGTLTSSLETYDFSDTEIAELNTGLGSTYAKIYNIYTAALPLKNTLEYDLYLFVDESVTSSSGTFQAGVAIKSYEREKIALKINDICDNESVFTDCIKKLAIWEEESNVYYHNSMLENSAGDNSYRYAGSYDKVNNFVCFGSDAETCPTNNLYRIIGIFENRVKLIKWDYALKDSLGVTDDYALDYGSKMESLKWTPGVNKGENSVSEIGAYYWNYKNDTEVNDGYGSNTWSTSLLNKGNLNTNFLNTFDDIWKNKIAMTTWKVGGNLADKIQYATVNITYQNEIVSPVSINSTDNLVEYESKIGLMYVSDYGYASEKILWKESMFNFNQTFLDSNKIGDLNWMYMGLVEWTITRNSKTSYYSYNIDYDGGIDYSYTYRSYAVRPVFYLNSDVKVFGNHQGTKTDPIRIN